MASVKLQGPDNAGGFSHGGMSFDADEDGIIEIPAQLADIAKAHGFSAVTIKDASKAKKPLAKIAEDADEEESKSDKPAKEDASKAVKGGGK